ncbi:MAG: Unknown protein [uncultured Sulfurovum sp.]|uniref:Uncharacterized protein n=1 Tax=uncultured Sulfurovum sp. TaxID=269237 RepID=A0A6S6SSW6_9BACT|nr:MAG: Unknown protein [uncultured Sulfurovum sp.]
MFINIDKLLENETDPRKLGYFSYAVSIFDGWLSRETYTASVELIRRTKHQDTNNKRINLLSMFYEKDIILYKDGRKFPFKSKEDYLNQITQAINTEHELTLLSPNYCAIIQITYDYTDILHFTKKKYIDLIKKNVAKEGLHIFTY